MAYPTTAELVAASTVDALTSLTEEQQDSLRTLAIAAIEDYCGQSFTASDEERLVESGGGETLLLPERIRTLRTVKSTFGDPLESTALTLGGKGDRIIFKQGVVGHGYYEQALYEISGRDYPDRFPKGYILIDAEWGWEDCPGEVAAAIRMDMEDAALAEANALTQTVHVFRKLGITSIDQGNLRADLGPVASLTPRVSRILEPYVFQGQAGHLV